VRRRLNPERNERLTAAIGLKRALTTTGEDLRSTTRREVQGATWRGYALVAALIVGLAVAIAVIPAQHRWVDLPRHHDRNAKSR
jgi:hypothetical protein